MDARAARRRRRGVRLAHRAGNRPSPAAPASTNPGSGTGSRRRSRRACVQGRAQVVLRSSLAGRSAAEQRALRAQASSVGAAGQAADQRHQEQERRRRRTRPDCRAGRARACGRAGRASAACPGASPPSRRQSRGPAAVEGRLDQVVVADRGAAGRHQHVGAAVAARGRSPRRCRRGGRATMPRSSDLGAFAARQRGEGKAVGRDDLVGPRRRAGRHQLVAGARGARPGAGGAPARVGWFIAAASARSRPVSRWPRASSTSPALKSRPCGGGRCGRAPSAEFTTTMSPLARRSLPGSRPCRRRPAARRR